MSRPAPATDARLGALMQQLAPLRQRWSALAPRERLLVGAAALVLGIFLLWSVAIAPALRSLSTAPARLAEVDAQLAQMRRLAAEAGELRALPPVAPPQAEAALQSATQRLGAAARLQASGERITVQFTAIEPAALAAWLDEVRSAARVRVVEAQLGRSGNGYSGSIVLTLAAPR